LPAGASWRARSRHFDPRGAGGRPSWCFDIASIGIKEDEVTTRPSGTPRPLKGADGGIQVVVGGQVVLEQASHRRLRGRVLRAAGSTERFPDGGNPTDRGSVAAVSEGSGGERG